MYIENIVIGQPLIEPVKMFDANEIDWKNNEKDATFFTNGRFLPRILVELGIYPSVSEVRRNRPDLIITLDSLDFIDRLKVSKRRFLWILVGE